MTPLDRNWAERDSPEYAQTPQDRPYSPQRPEHVLVAHLRRDRSTARHRRGSGAHAETADATHPRPQPQGDAVKHKALLEAPNAGHYFADCTCGTTLGVYPSRTDARSAHAAHAIGTQPQAPVTPVLLFGGPARGMATAQRDHQETP